jgi:hypothetical protein
MTRLVAAYHALEKRGPGKGIVLLKYAIKGHRARVASGTAEGLSAERRMAWPPVVEDGRAKWKEPDLARIVELAEEGRAIGRPKRAVYADGRPRAPGV